MRKPSSWSWRGRMSIWPRNPPAANCSRRWRRSGAIRPRRTCAFALSIRSPIRRPTAHSRLPRRASRKRFVRSRTIRPCRNCRIASVQNCARTPSNPTIQHEYRAMKGSLGKIMQQAQEMQGKMQQVQDELAQMEITGESGAGLVKVTMTGKHEVSKVVIDPSVFEDDRELLEDLVAAAINDAVQRVNTQSQEKMSELTGGLNLPPGMNLPF